MCRQVLRANGKTSFISFLFLLSPCWFVLVSLMAAVMAAALCERERTRLAEASRKEKEFNQIVKALRKRGGEEVECCPSVMQNQTFVSRHCFWNLNNARTNLFIDTHAGGTVRGFPRRQQGKPRATTNQQRRYAKGDPSG